jgi:catechol 2,3-dioxygenase-like lactoylglutathione lyase family enzyme
MRKILFTLFAAFLLGPALAAGAPPRPAITGIAHIRFTVASLDASRQFYGKLLGLSECPAAEGLCYRVNDHQAIELVAGKDPGPGAIVDVAFQTANVKQMRAFLTAHGVQVSEIKKNSNGEKFIEMLDPEGNHIQFLQYTKPLGAATTADAISLLMIHCGFIVRDRAAEDHFYADLLGFHLYWWGGRQDTVPDWVDMQVPEGADWLEYMLNVPAIPTPHLLGVVNHVSLGVQDGDAAEALLRAHGWDGAQKDTIGRDGKWQLGLYDPDGTRIELMELKLRRPPCCSEFNGRSH